MPKRSVVDEAVLWPIALVWVLKGQALCYILLRVYANLPSSPQGAALEGRVERLIATPTDAQSHYRTVIAGTFRSWGLGT